MDALDSSGRLAGDAQSSNLWDWFRGIFARLFGADLATPAALRAHMPIELNDEQGTYVVAPGGYRIRIPSREDALPTGDAFPSVKEALATVPPLPSVVIELIREVQNPTSTAASIAAIAASDPTLASLLLRTVNSTAFGLNRRVTSVAEAINYLGFGMVRSLVVRLRLDQVLPRGNAQSAADAQDLWVHCLAVSYVADCLADRVPGVDRGMASTLGLLHDIGKLAIIAKLNVPEQTAQSQDQSVQSREMTAYGLDHCGIGSALANRWGLPADLVQAIRWHHEPDKAFEIDDPPALRKAVYLVQVANELAKYGYPYAADMELDGAADSACEVLGLGNSTAKLMDAKVRGAITRAILFAAENTDSAEAQPRRFVKLLSGEEAAGRVAQLQSTEPKSSSRSWVRVNDHEVRAALASAPVSVEVESASPKLSAPAALASAPSARFVASATAAGIEKLIAAVLAHQQSLPLASAARGPAGLIVRALLPNLIEPQGGAGVVEIVQSAPAGKLSLAVQSTVLGFDRRLPNHNPEQGCQLVESELASVRNLDWFQTVCITPDGTGWLFAGR